jgi:hypothetical protein
MLGAEWDDWQRKASSCASFTAIKFNSKIITDRGNVLEYNMSGFSLNFRWTVQLEKSRRSMFFVRCQGVSKVFNFLKKNNLVLIFLFSWFHFRFCTSVDHFPRTEITKPIKIVTEKLLHISQGFSFCDGQNIERYQYQQCINYKPGSNKNIHDKVDLRSLFR